MTWNYRLVKRHTKNPQNLGGNEYVTYAIHEAFYDEDGKVWSITENPTDLSAEHLNELMISWDMMTEAFSQPILDWDEIGNNPPGVDPITEDLNEEGELETHPIEDLFSDLPPFDAEAYYREEAKLNEEEELQHTEEFIGRSPEHIQELIKTLRSQSP